MCDMFSILITTNQKLITYELYVSVKFHEVALEYSSKIKLSFFPWIHLSAERKNIPCSADWIVTIVKPQEQLIKLYEDKVNGRDQGDQSSIID